MAQLLWNTCDPKKGAPAYIEDSLWRNRDRFIKGSAEIEACLTRKWANELGYQLKMELFLFSEEKLLCGLNMFGLMQRAIIIVFAIEHGDFAVDVPGVN